MGQDGRKYVKEFIDYVVKYYIEQTKADNHAVREAACHSIAELALKVWVLTFLAGEMVSWQPSSRLPKSMDGFVPISDRERRRSSVRRSHVGSAASMFQRRQLASP